MTRDPFITQRVWDHEQFAPTIAPLIKGATGDHLRGYWEALTDCGIAQRTEATDAYMAGVLVRLEIELSPMLAELDHLLEAGEASASPAPRPAPLDDAGAERLRSFLVAGVDVSAHESLFDAILGHQPAILGTEPERVARLARFAAVYHGLIHRRVHGTPVEAEEQKVFDQLAGLRDGAERDLETLVREHGPQPPRAVCGDTARLQVAMFLPAAWRQAPAGPPRATGSSGPASDGSKRKRGRKRITPAPPTSALPVGMVVDTPMVEIVGSQTSNSTVDLGEFTQAFSFEAAVPDTVYQVNIGLLRPHADNDKLFTPVDAEAQSSLEDDVREHGLEHPMLVCGVGCASAPGTILRGHRRHAALRCADVPVAPAMIVKDLGATDELFLMIRGNLADAHARKLTQEAKYLLEEEARRVAGERRGRPPAAGNSVRTDGISGQETVAVIAAQLDEQPSAVRDRKKVFGSPCSTSALQAAVNGLRMKVSPAAALVRRIEGAHGLGRGEGNTTDQTVITAARGALDAELATLLGGTVKRRTSAKKSDTKSNTTPTGATPPQPSPPARPAGPAAHGDHVHAGGVSEDLRVLEGAAQRVRAAIETAIVCGKVQSNEAATTLLAMLAALGDGSLRHRVTSLLATLLTVDALHEPSSGADPLIGADGSRGPASSTRGAPPQSNTDAAQLAAASAFLKASTCGTGIEWANETWNPWTGCSKVSEGCRNCYAIPAAVACARRGVKHYEGITKKMKNGAANWTGEVHAAPDHIWEKPLHYRPGTICFVNSMSDFFYARATDDMRVRAIDVMRQCPDVAFLSLTKRPEDVTPFLARTGTTLPDNVWLGVSVESSEHLHRIDLLRDVPVAIRFLSIEPLLGNVTANGLDLSGIQWVIVGGESGPEARPMELEWVRGVRDACVAQNVPLFMKQWGRWQNNPLARAEDGRMLKAGELEKLDPHGKGGALLDGKLLHEMPSLYWTRWEPLCKPKRRLRLVDAANGLPGGMGDAPSTPASWPTTEHESEGGTKGDKGDNKSNRRKP